MPIKKKRKLTIKQRKFIDEVIKTGNATEAAARTYKTKNRRVANAVWNENLAKPSIHAEIEDRLKIAKDIIYKLAVESKKEEIKLKASQDIIDRWEWKPTQKIEQKVDWDLNINIVKYDGDNNPV